MDQQDLRRRHHGDHEQHAPQAEERPRREQRDHHAERVEPHRTGHHVGADHVIVDLLHDQQHRRRPDGEGPPGVELDGPGPHTRGGEGDEQRRDGPDEGADQRDEVEQPGDQADGRPIRQAHQPQAQHRGHGHERRHQELAPEVPADRHRQLVPDVLDLAAPLERDRSLDALPQLGEVHQQVEPDHDPEDHRQDDVKDPHADRGDPSHEARELPARTEAREQVVTLDRQPDLPREAHQVVLSLGQEVGQALAELDRLVAHHGDEVGQADPDGRQDREVGEEGGEAPSHPPPLQERDRRIQQVDDDEREDQRREDDPDRIQDVSSEQVHEHGDPHRGPGHDAQPGGASDQGGRDDGIVGALHGRSFGDDSNARAPIPVYPQAGAATRTEPAPKSPWLHSPGMTRPLIIASNRGPVSFHLDEEGEPVSSRGGGGLVTGLTSALQGASRCWTRTPSTTSGT